MAQHLLLSILRAVRRALLTFAATATLIFVYGVAVLWLFTPAVSAPVVWFVLVPLAVAVALLIATLVLLWYAAPVVTVVRALRYLSTPRDQAPTVLDAPVVPTRLEEPTVLPPPADPRFVAHSDPRLPRIPRLPAA